MDRPFVVERSKYETRTRNYECKMMHDMFMQKCDDCFEGFIKVNCKHCRGTRFHLKIVKILQKVRTKPRKKFLTKAKAQLRFLKLYFLMFFLTKSISLMFTKNLYKSFMF